MQTVKKQYGLWTGIAMVVGIVIGSGVFLKAGGVLSLAGGDLKISLLAWLIGGIIMIASGFCFAVFATKITKYNGVVDYVETATNKKVGYGLAWILTTFYYPIITSIVALFAGSYFFTMIGANVGLTDPANFLFAFGVVTLLVILNYFSPMLSAKFQISATIIKLIPILIIAVVGLFASFIVGDDVGVVNAFTTNAEGYALNFGDAIKKTSFAYEGWVCATAINAELKDSKKNLPRALVGGTIAILVFYLIYYISLSAFLGNAGTIMQDANAPIAVFESIMGKAGSIIFTFFILISCIGTVNGVTISCCRGMYTMSCRGMGISPKHFSKLGKNQSVSFLSCLYGYACITLMFIVWYLVMHNVWIFGKLGSMDEIVCAIIYAVYIAMYIYIMKNFKEYNVFKRFIMPIIAIIGSLFFTFCGTGLYQLISTGSTESLEAFGIFMGLFAVLMFPCIFFYKKDKIKDLEENNNESTELFISDYESKGLVYEINGAQKILRVYEDRVTLEQIKNIRALLTKNWFKGIKEIFYVDMLGIQFREATDFVLGYIQFETASCYGENNYNSENSWTYDNNKNITNEKVKEIKDFIRKKMELSKKPTTVVQHTSIADEISKLKSLLDEGIITEEEFNIQKKSLLK